MKGLLVKDFRLLMQRKCSFVIIMLCGLAMIFSTDASFFIGWMIMIGSLFALSTIAYDEHDNCFPFLMTLPVSRKCYAFEKYLFGALIALASWICGVVFYALISALRRTGFDLQGEIAVLSVMLPVPLLILDFSIPFNLKYGSEKGRIYMLVFWGVIFGAVFAVVKLVPSVKEFSFSGMSVSGASVVITALIVTAAVTAASVAWSVRIMEKKEF